MKNKRILSFVIAALFAFQILSFAEGDYGAAAAKADTALSYADMLNYALQDEYLARAEYRVIMEKFGVSRPFSNIERSENTHISWLEPLFEKYGLSIASDEATPAAPKSLSEAYQAGVSAEKENIAMYERFLAQPNLPDDMAAVFTQLRDASKNHLRAFERQLTTSSSSRRSNR